MRTTMQEQNRIGSLYIYIYIYIDLRQKNAKRRGEKHGRNARAPKLLLEVFLLIFFGANRNFFCVC